MSRPTGGRGGRRRRSRRLLFCLAVLSLLTAPSGVADARAQAVGGVRITRRHARVARDTDGGYRLIEALDVEDSRPSGDTAPLALAVIPEDAEDVLSLGGDVSPTRVVYDANRLVLLGAPPTPQYRLLFTYRLAPTAEALLLRAVPAVNELVLEVDRGSVDAAPGRPLTVAGDGGTPARPSRRYTAQDLPPGVAVRLRLIRRQTGWRERLAVLLVVAAAAGFGGVRVWRRAR